MSPIKISLTDDHPLAISGIRSMLADFKDIEIIASYNSGDELLAGLSTELPDILLLDILLPDQSGKLLMPKIKESYPDLKVIALTSLDAPAMVSSMMRRGCNGYLLKGVDSQTLVTAINQVYQGEDYIQPSLKEKLLNNLINFNKKDPKEIPEITRREKEILQLISDEYTTQEIADKLFISFRTVENHRYSLLQKLDVKNTAGLVKIAIKLGLVKPDFK